ncbi:hypothetical protein RND61_32110 [Streptomyces sp. TRM76323]|uniref:Integrase n=1 Tax=Streptomyces tamarix TaxID=3078565 RepID=A0ABU3QW18_9ACTN|nr:hypothetical protein [Streptomyces tamarix]MDT9686674.1 hypothetical protein [Streptomyces tamarix]
MSGPGRRAVLPDAGYRLPQRLFVDEDQCRVRFFPERGGEAVDIDLSVLPVSRELRDWMALGVLGVTGPAGTRRTTSSALDTVNILKRFCRYLASLSNPPTSPEQLKAVHLDGFLLSGATTLHRDVSALRTILRFAPDPPAQFAARLAQARVAKSDAPTQSYTEAEFRRIAARARSELRGAAARIRAARRLLAGWRAGVIGRDGDLGQWEEGFLLDCFDQHGDIPRYECGTPRQLDVLRRLGGIRAVASRLHLTHHEIGAAAVLLLCLTGQNYSTLAAATTAHHRPDGHAGGTPTAQLDLVKPRRGSRKAAMTGALRDVPAAPDQVREDLSTPFGVYDLLLDLAAPARARLGTDSLFAYYNAKDPCGRGFRQGLPKALLQLWGKATDLVCDAPDDEGRPVPLHIDSRRLRMTWLEINQRPVAHTESTLANEYLARNRGNLTEYQKIVADVLDQQVSRARTAPPIPVLSAQDIEQARTEPKAVAARHQMDTATLQQLITGRLDTVLAGCTSPLQSPFTPAGKPCGASFLLCLSCPCARATPAHLPVQVLVLDALTARKQQMTPLRWAERLAEPVARLTDLLGHYAPAVVADARAGATAADHALVERFLTRGLDLT